MVEPEVITNLRAWVEEYRAPARRPALGENYDVRYQTWVDMLAAYDELKKELLDTELSLRAAYREEL